MLIGKLIKPYLNEEYTPSKRTYIVKVSKHLFTGTDRNN